MNKEEISNLKLQGFINQKDKNYFSLRVIVEAGKISSDRMEKVIYIADKYGRGYISFTTRMSIEIPWIASKNIDEVKTYLKKYTFISGGTGKKIRPIVACKGTVCTHGLIDTQGIAEKLHSKYFARKLPAKVKIGIVGCPNNCAKASINDIGFMGQIIPKFNEEMCRKCGICISICKSHAIEKSNGKIIRDENRCSRCGECIKVCKFNALTTEKEGISVFVGGKFGRKYRIGNRLKGLFSSDKLEGITEKILDYYARNGKKGERIGDMIDRIGWSNMEKDLY